MTEPAAPLAALPASRRAPTARLGVMVVRELVRLVVTGEVPQGELLPPEGPLAEHFGVSRTIVRESMKRLEEKGLVTVAQGRGTRVTSFGTWNVLDPVVMSALIDNDDPVGVLDELTVVRAQLESAMAGQVAAHVDTLDLDELDEKMRGMHACSDDTDAFYEADAQFHYTVMRLSGNRLATNIASKLYRRARESVIFRGPHPEQGVARTLAEHEAILAAVRSGDVRLAESCMRDHITLGWERRRPQGRGPAVDGAGSQAGA